MGKIHHRGQDEHKHRHKKHGKRPCISAPSSPANVDIKFRKLERHKSKRWNARVKWDAVTTDVAGRTLPTNTDGNARADGYQIELQACDAGGDPIELPLQEDSADQTGGAFTDVSGTSTAIKQHERRINATGNVINSSNFTGLTAGIEVVVQFFAHIETSGSASVKFEVWNQSAGSSVQSKTQTVTDSHHGKLQAKMKFTPSGGTNYRARVTYVSGSQKPVLTKVEWGDVGDTALWKKTAHDEDTSILFKELARPKVWYYRARVRARSNHHGHRCWSAWSGWTTAINPVTGDEVGLPAPDGLTLTFDRVESAKKHPFRAVCVWNEAGWWIPPDGDAEEGAKKYAIKFASSDDAGSTTLNVRHKVIEARDSDADQTATTEFNKIRRKRHYRFAVKALDFDNNWGAWSAWTSWTSPIGGVGSAPGDPTNVVQSKPVPRHILTEWDPPANDEDVDRYRVRVYQGNPPTNLKETAYVRGQVYRYHVPEADKGTAHRVKITAVDEDNNMSNEVDQGTSTTEGGTLGGDIITPGTIGSGGIGTDGSAPGTATGLTLDGSLGILVAKWTPVTNNDLVVYEAHLSTTTGFTPGAGTKCGETTGTTFVFRKTAAGGALSYGTTYYCKIIAKDPDGAAAASSQASSTLAQVAAADIVAHTITANEIFAGTITSTELHTGAVTASKIDVTQLSAISADLGTVTAGEIRSALFSTNAGSDPSFIEIDGGSAKDRIRFDSSGTATFLVATNAGLRIGNVLSEKIGFWGKNPVSQGASIANLTIAGSPAENDAMEDTSGVSAAVHRNFGDLHGKVNAILNELKRIGLFA